MEKIFKNLASMSDVQCMDYAYKVLKNHNYEFIAGSKYLMASPKKPNTHSVVGLVAHCDTVSTHRKDGQYPKKIVNQYGVLRVKDGGVLGADDRAGVASILEIVKNGQRPHVYLTTDEEVGCLGADDLIKDFPECPHDINVLIQIDRRGNNDYVTYDCDSKDLNKWVENFGWSEEIGSFSDISTICPQWGIAGVNLSCGYYNEHSDSECLVLPQLEHTVQRIRAMIDSPPLKLEYIAGVSNYGNYGYGRWNHYQYESTTVADDYVWDKESNTSMYKCAECQDMFDWTEMDFNTFLCLECKEDLFELGDDNDDN